MAACACQGTMHNIDCTPTLGSRTAHGTGQRIPFASDVYAPSGLIADRVQQSGPWQSMEEWEAQKATEWEAQKAVRRIAEAKQEHEVSQLTAQLDRLDEALIHLERIAEVFRRAFTARLTETEVHKQVVKGEQKRRKAIARFDQRLKRRPAKRAK